MRKQTKQAPAHKRTNAKFLSKLVNCLSCKLASVRFAQCRINEGFWTDIPNGTFVEEWTSILSVYFRAQFVCKFTCLKYSKYISLHCVPTVATKQLFKEALPNNKPRHRNSLTSNFSHPNSPFQLKSNFTTRLDEKTSQFRSLYKTIKLYNYINDVFAWHFTMTPAFQPGAIKSRTFRSPVRNIPSKAPACILDKFKHNFEIQLYMLHWSL